MPSDDQKTTPRHALNAVRVASDPSPVVLLTASADDALLMIAIEAEVIQRDNGARIRGSFGWEEARRFAEGMLVVVADAEERSRERDRQRLEDDNAE
jgi:hypothetical protein